MATLDVDGVVSLLIPALLSSINHFLSHTSFSLTLFFAIPRTPVSALFRFPLRLSVNNRSSRRHPLSQSITRNQSACSHFLCNATITNSISTSVTPAKPRYTEDPTPHTTAHTRHTSLHYTTYSIQTRSRYTLDPECIHPIAITQTPTFPTKESVSQ